VTSPIENLNKGVAAATQRHPNAFYKGFFKNTQAALIMLADRLAKKNKRYYNEARESLAARTLDGSEVCGVDIGSMSWRTGYQNIIPVESSDNYPADVASNLLLSQGPAVNKFFTFEITSAQQALLVPKIRIYKVLYETTYDQNTGTYKLVHPIKAKPNPPEIVFEAFTKSADINDIIISGQGKIPGVGLKSFEWALKGVNPADVDANIEASIEIFFNNVGDVLSARDGTGTASFLNLILFTPPLLQGQDKRQLPNPCQNEEYQEEYFEIMAEVGWAVPTEDGALKSGLFTSQQLHYIGAATKRLYLQLTTHAFDFKQDGSAVLKANYRARMKLSDPRHDIINFSVLESYNEELARHQEEMGEMKEDGIWQMIGGHYRQAINRSTDQNTQTGRSHEIRALEERKLSALQGRYRQLVEQLITEHVYSVTIPYPLLLTDVNGTLTDYDLSQSSDTSTRGAYLDPKAAFGAVFSGEGTPAEQQQVFNRVVSPVQQAYQSSQGLQAIGPGSYVTNLEAQVELAGLGGGIRRRRELEAEAGGAGVESHDPGGLIGDITTTDEEVSIADLAGFVQTHGEAGSAAGANVKYFYLGDILEVLLTTGDVTYDIQEKKLAVIVPDIQFLNTFKVVALVKDPNEHHPAPGLSAGVDMADFKCKYALLNEPDRRQYLTQLNIANIPINVELFLDFFKRKIINSKTEQYYLGDFLSDIFHTFLKPVVSNNGIEGMSTTMPLAFISDLITSKNEALFSADDAIGYEQTRGYVDGEEHEYVVRGRGSHRAVPGDSTYTLGAPIDAYLKAANPNDQEPKINAIFRQEKDPTLRATVKILNLQMHFSHLNGEYSHNIDRGIPNFIVGLDRGIIKSVSFRRVDQPYLRESRTAQDKTFGTGQLRELYHCNLTLYGNTLLLPGQLIYVEPNNVTFGRPTSAKSPARILGLGGYHLVVDVANTLNSSGWETKVNALHVAMPAYARSGVVAAAATSEGQALETASQTGAVSVSRMQGQLSPEDFKAVLAGSHGHVTTTTGGSN
jgi:hypothetical protein